MSNPFVPIHDAPGRSLPFDLPDRRAVVAGIAAMAATGCGPTPTPALRDHDGEARTGWPRTIAGAGRDVELSAPPKRIVSTSVTLTGTLLAIGAPVIASAATSGGSEVADDQGFFNQWGAVARQRGVRPLYVGDPNVEAVAAVAPDLIVVSGTGGDSAMRVVDQLAQIAPVLVVDYGNRSWQDLALLFGRATGREAQARAVIAGFDREIARTARRLRLPPQPTTAMVYYEDGSGANIWTPVSAQGRLLRALGFALATIPPHVHGTGAMGRRRDVIQVTGEQFADALTGRTILLFAADETVVQAMCSNPFLAHVPAVAAKRVHAMGRDSFRLDLYSAQDVLRRIAALFDQAPADTGG